MLNKPVEHSSAVTSRHGEPVTVVGEIAGTKSTSSNGFVQIPPFFFIPVKHQDKFLNQDTSTCAQIYKSESHLPISLSLNTTLYCHNRLSMRLVLVLPYRYVSASVVDQ